MDPVFQRLGDVTIQRLEKPKENKLLPQVDITPRDEDTNRSEECNGVEAASSKRNTEVAGPSNKRFKLDLANVTLEKKNSDESSVLNYSDNELSEYDSESEIESEGEETPPRCESPKEEKVAPDESSSAFLDTFAEEPLQDDPAAESASGDTEDYDYDIKQKLKEMGEISFETVKKSDVKPKKVERVTENEVVVTPAKKSSRF